MCQPVLYDKTAAITRGFFHFFIIFIFALCYDFIIMIVIVISLSCITFIYFGPDFQSILHRMAYANARMKNVEVETDLYLDLVDVHCENTPSASSLYKNMKFSIEFFLHTSSRKNRTELFRFTRTFRIMLLILRFRTQHTHVPMDRNPLRSTVNGEKVIIMMFS